MTKKFESGLSLCELWSMFMFSISNKMGKHHPLCIGTSQKIDGKEKHYRPSLRSTCKSDGADFHVISCQLPCVFERSEFPTLKASMTSGL